MREAIGASWLMVIVLTFIALFSGYLAFSINYSKDFKVKDGIIDRIEKHNGPNSESIADIAEFLTDIGYSSRGSCDQFLGDNNPIYVGVLRDSVTKRPQSGEYNYCIQKVQAYNPAGQLSASYYKVVVFFSLSLPVFDQFTSFNVTGETVNLYYPDDDWMN